MSNSGHSNRQGNASGERPRGREYIRARRPRLGALLIALLVACGCMFLARKCSRPAAQTTFPASYPAKSGGDTIDVAIAISPLSYSLGGDTVTGLDYDMLREMAAIHGRAVKFHPYAPAEYALAGLRDGVFDVMVSSLPSTATLKDELLLTDQVYLDREVLVQRKGADGFVDTPLGLAGDTVWMAKGSPLVQRVRNLADEIGDTIYINQDHPHTAEHLALLVAQGSIPRAVVNEGLARSVAASFPELDLSVAVSFTQFQTWAIAPGRPELRDTINSWLASFRATPRYTELVERYMR